MNTAISKLRSVNLRDWYRKTYPEDAYGMLLNEISLYTVWFRLVHGTFTYETLGKCADTIIRERVFEEIASRLNLKCATIYDMWLNFAESPDN